MTPSEQMAANSAVLTQTSADVGGVSGMPPPAVPMNFPPSGVPNQKAPATGSRSSQHRGHTGKPPGHHPFRNSNALPRSRSQYTAAEKKEMEAASKVGYWRGRRLDGGHSVYTKSHESIIALGLKKPYDHLFDDQIATAIENAMDDLRTSKRLRPGDYHLTYLITLTHS
jgi:hypothetical protein